MGIRAAKYLSYEHLGKAQVRCEYGLPRHLGKGVHSRNALPYKTVFRQSRRLRLIGRMGSFWGGPSCERRASPNPSPRTFNTCLNSHFSCRENENSGNMLELTSTRTLGVLILVSQILSVTYFPRWPLETPQVRGLIRCAAPSGTGILPVIRRSIDRQDAGPTMKMSQHL